MRKWNQLSVLNNGRRQLSIANTHNLSFWLGFIDHQRGARLLINVEALRSLSLKSKCSTRVLGNKYIDIHTTRRLTKYVYIHTIRRLTRYIDIDMIRELTRYIGIEIIRRLTTHAVCPVIDRHVTILIFSIDMNGEVIRQQTICSQQV